MAAHNGADVFSEPLRVTLARTFTIAICVALVVAASGPGLRSWPALAVVMLWPALGGHWIDLFFLNWPRLISFIGIEPVAHAALQFRGRPSFYDGRG